jgi:hypothetical protein
MQLNFILKQVKKHYSHLILIKKIKYKEYKKKKLILF